MAQGKKRDVERTREDVLSAAETLFAEKGIDGVSLQDIGERAGVSRGTPNYLFGSKDSLYRLVLERILAAENASSDLSLAALSPDDPSEKVIAVAIESHLDFLMARPAFLKLMTREALSGGAGLGGTPTYLTVMNAGLTLLKSEKIQSILRPMDSAQLLLSILSLCWLPLAYRSTLLPAIGVNPDSPAFWEARKHHIVDFLLRGLMKSDPTRPDQR